MDMKYPHKFDYIEQGDGPTILFVPGSFSSVRAWEGVQRHLPKGYRFVTTALLGCGGTDETRSFDHSHMDHFIDLIAAVAEKAATPVHLVGHSCGGMAAFGAALSGRVDIRSLTTFETNNMTVLAKHGFRQIYDEAFEIGRIFEGEYLAGNRDAAAIIIDYWGGKGAFAAMPPSVQESIRKATLGNVLDWRTAKTFLSTKADYAAMNIPVQLVRGSLANDVIKAVHDTLSTWIPNAKRAEVEGAGHFLITSHAKECAALLQGFLAQLS